MVLRLSLHAEELLLLVVLLLLLLLLLHLLLRLSAPFVVSRLFRLQSAASAASATRFNACVVKAATLRRL